MSWRTFFCLLLLLGAGAAPILACDSCPAFGTEFPRGLADTSNKGLWLNFATPAQCSGTAVAWRFCYYVQYSDDDQEVWLRVYRKNGVGSYTRVIQDIITRTYEDSENLIASCSGGNPPFCCETLSLASHQIQKNDIIGVCMRDSGRHDPLYSLDGRAPAGYSVYQYPNTDDCNMAGDVQSFTTLNSGTSLREFDRYGLHASLNITADTAACSVGSNPPPFQASTAPGLYLNLEHPSQCHGLITTLHYCYYPTGGAGSKFVTVEVWRQSQPAADYSLVAGSSRTLTVTTETSLAAVICGTETLAEADYISINENDVIGVRLPSSSPLPIVASGALGYSLAAKNTDPGANIQIMTSRALHLYADIMITTPPAVVPSSTPTPDTGFVPTQPGMTELSASTMQTQETLDSTDPMATGSTSPGTDAGLVAGVVISLVVIVALVVVFGVVLLLLLRRHSKTHRTNGEVLKLDAINNAVYDPVVKTASFSNKMTTPANSAHDYYTEPVYSTALGGPQFEDAPETYYSATEEVPEYHSLIQQVMQEGDVTYEDPSPYAAPARNEDELYRQIQSSGIKRIARDSIVITDYLGSGEFGKVEQGTMRTSQGKMIDIAVKTLHKNATLTDKVRFLQEAAIMAQFRHPNVVSMYGVVKDQELLMLAVELLSKGDLRNFLTAMRPDPGQLLPSSVPRQLLGFCQQVALGMQYLSTRSFVHRDLAARNVLLSAKNVCKIGDFGMSRDLADESYYVSKGGKVPVKWTAPEALHYKKYSSASDVWSYGCLLYEIWSIGHKPFEGYGNPEVIRKVDSGYRLSSPPGCPKTVYEMMIQCWHPDTASRPTFRDILVVLLGDESKVLEIPHDALSSHRQAGVLGAPLEAGEGMYRELQRAYIM